MQIDTKYLDVDFRDPAVNQGNLLGCEERDDLLGESFPLFEDAFRLIPEAEWERRIVAIEAAGGWLDGLLDEIEFATIEPNALTLWAFVQNDVSDDHLGEFFAINRAAVSLFPFNSD